MYIETGGSWTHVQEDRWELITTHFETGESCSLHAGVSSPVLQLGVAGGKIRGSGITISYWRQRLGGESTGALEWEVQQERGRLQRPGRTFPADRSLPQGMGCASGPRPSPDPSPRFQPTHPRTHPPPQPTPAHNHKNNHPPPPPLPRLQVALHGGAANKNIGDAFLLVWKLPERLQRGSSASNKSFTAAGVGGGEKRSSIAARERG